ncbi:L,D-transpeptidase family protein [Pedobacter sp.]|uniref:L,D-transpeptidase family protein n=1 Tax=Pedobacter sp. TaxID=1411316 RepID=UPI003C3B2FFA
MKNVIRSLSILFLLCILFQPVKAGALSYLKQDLKDTTLVTGFHTDSNRIENFILYQRFTPAASNQIRQFYESRDYQHAWVTEDGLSEHAQIFLNLYDNYQFYSADSTLRDPKLNAQIELLQSEGIKLDSIKSYGELELQLTDFFMRFIKRAYSGKVNPENFQWHIPRKKIKIAEVMNTLVSSNDLTVDSWLPISKEFIAMRAQVIRLKSLDPENWIKITLMKGRVLRQGDTSKIIKTIKNRLMILGDLTTTDTTSLYDHNLVSAVESFQARHGLTVDAIIGPKSIETLNIPIEEKLKQMLINMERMRWMPQHNESKRVEVNIPAFRMHVYQGIEDVLSMDVVVGKAATRTVIFSDQIKHVVFSPYWNLPMSIVKNEVVPGLERNKNYIADHNMEIRGEQNGLPIVRQKPGPGNALGRVKFIFPNKYSIYLHDTPSRQLFKRTTRAFSHGCIRVEDPFAFASNLLSPQKEWTSRKIKEAMHENSEKWVNLDSPVPVYITYFTSWVDSSGKLNFRKDIYGHDRRLAEHLFTP